MGVLPPFFIPLYPLLSPKTNSYLTVTYPLNENYLSENEAVTWFYENYFTVNVISNVKRYIFVN